MISALFQSIGIYIYIYRLRICRSLSLCLYRDPLMSLLVCVYTSAAHSSSKGFLHTCTRFPPVGNACVYARLYVRVHSCTDTCICSYIFFHLDISVCIHIYIYIYIYVNIHFSLCVDARLPGAAAIPPFPLPQHKRCSRSRVCSSSSSKTAMPDRVCTPLSWRQKQQLQIEAGR